MRRFNYTNYPNYHYSRYQDYLHSDHKMKKKEEWNKPLIFSFVLLTISLVLIGGFIFNWPIFPFKTSGNVSEGIGEGTSKNESIGPINQNISSVFIHSNYYEPSQINITKGEKIRWINKDNKEHILVSLYVDEDNPLFDVTIPKGEDFSWTFNSKGEYRFWDPDIKNMNGSILVK